jgi:GPH family glycoside/pentoside/hexuronide:cation symporter
MFVVGAFSVLVVCGLWACFAGTREEKEIQGQTGVPLFRSLALTFSNRGFVVLGLAYALLIIGLWGGFGLSNYVTIYYVLGGVNNDMAAKLQMVAGLIMTPTSMAGCVFWAWIGTHIGKRNGLLASLFTIAAIAPFSWFLFTPTMPYLQLVMSGLLGFCFGALTVFPNSMVADLCDLDEVQSFARREGAYNGIIAFVVKVGFSGTFFMTGALLKLSGFNEKIDVQAPEAMTRIRILMAVIPVLVMAMAAILLIFYPLNEKRVHEIRDILEKRRAERLSEKAEGMELSTT